MIRAATVHDVQEVMVGIKKLYATSKSAHMKWADVMEAELAIRDAVHQNGYTEDVTENCRAVIADGYFIMYSVGPLWFTTKCFVLEDIVLRCGPTVKGHEGVLMTFKALQRHHNAVGCIVGDQQRGIIGATYEQHGTKLGSFYLLE